MGPQLAARALMLMGALALVVAGVGFASYALYLGFLPSLNPAGAAVATAAILLAIPALGVFIMALRGQSAIGHGAAQSGDPTLNVLADVARDKPLVAMLLAGLVGAAGAMNNSRK